MADSTILAAKLREVAHNDIAAVVLADQFEEVAKGFYAGTVPVKSFLGAWARARRKYCDLTGEALL